MLDSGHEVPPRHGHSFYARVRLGEVVEAVASILVFAW